MFELMTMALKVEKIVIIIALCKGHFIPYRMADTRFVFLCPLLSSFVLRRPDTII